MDKISNVTKRNVDIDREVSPDPKDQKLHTKDLVDEREVSSVIKDVDEPSVLDMELEASLKKKALYTDTERDSLKDWVSQSIFVEKTKAMDRFKKHQGIGVYNKDPESLSKFLEFDLSDFLVRSLQVNGSLFSKYKKNNFKGLSSKLKTLLDGFDRDFIQFYDALNLLRFDERLSLFEEYIYTVLKIVMEDIQENLSFVKDSYINPEQFSKNWKDDYLSKWESSKKLDLIPPTAYYDFNVLTNGISNILPEFSEKLKSNSINVLEDIRYDLLDSLSDVIESSKRSYQSLLDTYEKMLDETGKTSVTSARFDEETGELLGADIKPIMVDPYNYETYLNVVVEKGEDAYVLNQDRLGEVLKTSLVESLIDKKISYYFLSKDVSDFKVSYVDNLTRSLSSLRESYNKEYGFNSIADSAFMWLTNLFKEVDNLDKQLRDIFVAEEEGNPVKPLVDFHNTLKSMLDALEGSYLSKSNTHDAVTPYSSFTSSLSEFLQDSVVDIEDNLGYLKSYNLVPLANSYGMPFLVDEMSKYTDYLSTYFSKLKTAFNAFSEELNTKSKKHKSMVSTFKVNQMLRELVVSPDNLEGEVQLYKQFMESDPHFEVDTVENLFNLLESRYQWDKFTRRSLDSLFISLRTEYRRAAKDDSGNIIRDRNGKTKETEHWSDAEADIVANALLGVSSFSQKSDYSHLYTMVGSSPEFSYPDFSVATESGSDKPLDFSALIQSVFKEFNAEEHNIYVGNTEEYSWMKKKSLLNSFFDNIVDSNPDSEGFGGFNLGKHNLHMGPYYFVGLDLRKRNYSRGFENHLKEVRQERDSSGNRIKKVPFERVNQTIDKPEEKNYGYVDKLAVWTNRETELNALIGTLQAEVKKIAKQLRVYQNRYISDLASELKKEVKSFTKQLGILNKKINSLDKSDEKYNEKLEYLNKLVEVCELYLADAKEDLKLAGNKELASRRSSLTMLFNSFYLGAFQPLELLSDSISESVDVIEDAKQEIDAFNELSEDAKANYKVKAPDVVVNFVDGHYYADIKDEALELSRDQLDLVNKFVYSFQTSKGYQLQEHMSNFLRWKGKFNKRSILDFYPSSANVEVTNLKSLFSKLKPRVIRGQEFIGGSSHPTVEPASAIFDNGELDGIVEDIQDLIKFDISQEVPSYRLDNFKLAIEKRLKAINSFLSNELSDLVAEFSAILSDREPTGIPQMSSSPYARSRYPKGKSSDIVRLIDSVSSEDVWLDNLSLSELVSEDLDNVPVDKLEEAVGFTNKVLDNFVKDELSESKDGKYFEDLKDFRDQVLQSLSLADADVSRARGALSALDRIFKDKISSLVSSIDNPSDLSSYRANLGHIFSTLSKQSKEGGSVKLSESMKSEILNVVPILEKYNKDVAELENLKGNIKNNKAKLLSNKTLVEGKIKERDEVLAQLSVLRSKQSTLESKLSEIYESAMSKDAFVKELEAIKALKSEIRSISITIQEKRGEISNLRSKIYYYKNKLSSLGDDKEKMESSVDFKPKGKDYLSLKRVIRDYKKIQAGLEKELGNVLKSKKELVHSAREKASYIKEIQHKFDVEKIKIDVRNKTGKNQAVKSLNSLHNRIGKRVGLLSKIYLETSKIKEENVELSNSISKDIIALERLNYSSLVKTDKPLDVLLDADSLNSIMGSKVYSKNGELSLEKIKKDIDSIDDFMGRYKALKKAFVTAAMRYKGLLAVSDEVLSKLANVDAE